MSEEDLKNLFNRALVEIRSGDHKSAINNLTKFLQTDPSNYAAFFNRAISKCELNDSYGAIADYTEAINYCPTPYLEALSNRSNIKLNLGDIDGAIEDLKKIYDYDQNYKNLFFRLGFAFQ